MAPFTIFLVEDDVDIREALLDALRDKGYDVDWAGDGEQALRRLRGGVRPGLILLDLTMPRMSGAEFRAAQSADPALSDLPVVLLSADLRMDERARALRVAASLRKPVDVDALYAVIERFRAVSKTSA